MGKSEEIGEKLVFQILVQSRDIPIIEFLFSHSILYSSLLGLLTPQILEASFTYKSNTNSRFFLFHPFSSPPKRDSQVTKSGRIPLTQLTCSLLEVALKFAILHFLVEHSQFPIVRNSTSTFWCFKPTASSQFKIHDHSWFCTLMLLYHMLNSNRLLYLNDC